MAILKNPRHEKFVQGLIQGMSQRKAYREAFPAASKWKDTTVDVKASKLFSDDKVLVRYEELIDESKNKSILSRIDRMMILTEIAGDDQEKPDSRMKAIDLLNKMDGEYINKLELTQPIDNSIKEMEDYFEQQKKRSSQPFME